MFLSRIEINPRLQKTLRAMASPQRFHAALENAFPTRPDKNADGNRDLLWRLDAMRQGGHIAYYLLVQSLHRPDFTPVIEQFGWPESGQKAETREYASLLEKLENGQRRRFRLRANPVSILPTGEPGAKHGKPHSHVSIEWQKRWLTDRLDKYGFRILDTDGAVLPSTALLGKKAMPAYETWCLDIVHRDTVQFMRAEKRGDRREFKRVTLSMATYEGLLEITDAALLSQTMRRGIGRAKAYGCGLLTLVEG